MPKNWCFRTVVLEKTLLRVRVPWTARRLNQSILKENQSWIFTRMTDAEAETPILWPPDAKSWLIGKDPDAEKDWRKEEKGMTEDETVGWNHQLSGHELSKLWEMVKDREAWHAAVHGAAKSQTRLRSWTTKRALPFPWKAVTCMSRPLHLLSSVLHHSTKVVSSLLVYHSISSFFSPWFLSPPLCLLD